MKNDDNGYRKAFGEDDASLAAFLRTMAKFDHHFCNVMAAGVDYTLKMEVRGNKGRMIHCRVSKDEFERPAGLEKEAERKSGKR